MKAVYGCGTGLLAVLLSAAAAAAGTHGGASAQDAAPAAYAGGADQGVTEEIVVTADYSGRSAHDACVAKALEPAGFETAMQETVKQALAVHPDIKLSL